MSSRPKQSMSELKLRRLLEHNQRLREDLGRPRIRVSEASASLIRYCKTTTDHLVSPLPFPARTFPLSLPPPLPPFPISLSQSHPALAVYVTCCAFLSQSARADGAFLYAGSICLGSCWQERRPVCAADRRWVL